MRLQLFKGTYGVLLFLAIIGLFLMLRRQAGDGLALLLWLGLIAIAAIGLVANESDAMALVGVVLGLISTGYLKWGGPVATRGGLLVDLSVGVYLLLTITLAVIWLMRRRSHTM